MNVQDYRETYRGLMEYARSEFGWSAARFKGECEVGFYHFRSKGESTPEAWCSAAMDVVELHAEEVRRDR
jgi:hypothetical protein